MAKKTNCKELINSNKQKSIRCRKLAKKTIKKLIKNNEKINFNTVADNSGLSRNFLYKHEDIKRDIKYYRDCQERKIKIRSNTSDKNKDKLIDCLYKEIGDLKETLNKQEIVLKKLEKENNFLKRLKYEY